MKVVRVGTRIKDVDLKKQISSDSLTKLFPFKDHSTQHNTTSYSSFIYSQLSLLFVKLLSKNGKGCVTKNKQSGQTPGHHLVNSRCFCSDSLQGPANNYIAELLHAAQSTSSLDKQQLDSWWHTSHCRVCSSSAMVHSSGMLYSITLFLNFSRLLL